MWKICLRATAAVTVLMTAPGVGMAGEALEFAPPGAWVKPQPILREGKADSGAPAAFLSMDIQSQFTSDGDSHYMEMTLKILTPQGLALGQPSAFWNPQTDTVTIHRVHILRGDEVIDVLAKGQTFTTLRRENNLERAMLDGNLTAVLQMEGVRVGDVVNYAMTLKRRDPVLQGRSEILSRYANAIKIGRTTYRATWDKTKPMRWAATADLPGVKVVKTASGSELTMELTDYKPPEVPAQAPPRYKRQGQVQLTEFTSWQEMAGLMAPLYVKASTLAPDSPLRAEIDKIRTDHAQPKDRAAAALRLVEEQVRYVYIGADLGNLTPADADVTWRRRFGDCKGKTALLLALLRELGIDADAVAVSTWAGDGMNESLPMIEVFDHVIVRVVIDGKTYWLDGTRIGDTSLDAVPVPTFEWGLPLRAGGDLTAIVMTPPDKPLNETIVRYDASTGLDAPAKLHVESIMRGDQALISHTRLAAMTTEEQDKWLRDLWAIFYDDATIETTSFTWEATTGELRMIMDGTSKMEWPSSIGKPRRFMVNRGYIGGEYGLEREDGPGKDAPVEVDFPRFERNTVSIVLPRQGKGFSISGEPVDKTLAGYALKRSFSLKDGVFTMDVVDRTLTAEVPAAEVLAAEPELERLSETSVFVVAPADYKATDDDVKAAKDNAPKTADEYLARAQRLSDVGQFEAAITDTDAALKLDPKAARAMTLRGSIRDLMKDEDGALADFAAALMIDRRDITALIGQATVYTRRKDHSAAITALTRVLDINPLDPVARQLRGAAYMSRGDKEPGLDDALANALLQPDSTAAAAFLAQAYAGNGQEDKALETLRAAAGKWPDDADMQVEVARALLSCSAKAEVCTQQRIEAVTYLDKAIGLKPSVDLYVYRAQTRPQSDRAGKFADLEAALALQPGSTLVLHVRGLTYLAFDELELARGDFEAVISRDPMYSGAFNDLAIVHEKRGDFDAQIRAADAALGLSPDDPGFLNSSCWARALSGRDLDRALDLCNASLTASPIANTYDSRALVHLRKGNLDAAIADYDTALAAAPYATGLYGRGIAKLQKGLTKAGKADLKAARKLDKTIDQTFAKYGVTPPQTK